MPFKHIDLMKAEHTNLSNTGIGLALSRLMSSSIAIEKITVEDANKVLLKRAFGINLPKLKRSWVVISMKVLEKKHELNVNEWQFVLSLRMINDMGIEVSEILACEGNVPRRAKQFGGIDTDLPIKKNLLPRYRREQPEFKSDWEADQYLTASVDHLLFGKGFSFRRESYGSKALICTPATKISGVSQNTSQGGLYDNALVSANELITWCSFHCDQVRRPAHKCRNSIIRLGRQKRRQKMKRQTDYGYEIKPVYTPKDIESLDYAKDVGDPGSYPFVRGYHPNGYRSRVWTRRMTAGLGSSKRTNEVLKQYREMGQTQGMLVICDRPNAMPIDADHPDGQKRGRCFGMAWSVTA